MSHPSDNWWWRGWLVGVVVFLLGVGLVISDRVAARAGDRAWILRGDAGSNIRAMPEPVHPKPLPDLASQIVFPRIWFHYTRDGSNLDDIMDWVRYEAHVELDVNWHMLESIGLTRKSTLSFDGTNVSLSDLLDALARDAASKSGTTAKLAWEAMPGRVVLISTASDLALERECREQRLKMATPALRTALDRRIPYVKLRELSVAEALDYCQRISGVKIRLLDDDRERVEETAVIAGEVTFENLIEIILRRTNGKSPGTWHFKVEGDGLLVFRGGEK